ncbi:transposable element Tc1 transposase [Trichonephila clavipes]|nr:transposable element Tc1 transposase [Trichonephila clavipes]
MIMPYVSDRKRCMIIGARLTRASLSGTDYLVGVSRTMVSNVMRTHTNLANVPSTKHNIGRKLLKGYYRRMLKRIISRKCMMTLSQVISEMNTPLQNPVSMKTIQRELHVANIHGRVDVPKPLECYEETTVVPRLPK